MIRYIYFILGSLFLLISCDDNRDTNYETTIEGYVVEKETEIKLNADIYLSNGNDNTVYHKIETDSSGYFYYKFDGTHIDYPRVSAVTPGYYMDGNWELVDIGWINTYKIEMIKED